MGTIRVLLADDHELVRKGIIALLQSVPDIEIVGEAEDGAEAIRKVEELHPDVVVLDLSMPRLSGVDATRAISRKQPDTAVLILTMHEDEEYLVQILKLGAKGYVVKSAGREELTLAIRIVAKGEQYFSHQVSSKLVREYMRDGAQRAQQPDGSEYDLTRRELEILSMIGEGLNNQQIGERLFISPRTVDTHRTNIMQKLDIHDAANLVRFAIEHGYAKKHPSSS
jgi:DNA-binding NarL/FixJ family response regulator